MKVYFDTCCYGRPYDDQTEPNTKVETDAILGAVELCKLAEVTIFGSPALIDEIDDIDDGDKGTRKTVREFYDDTVTNYIPKSADIVLRARDFMAQGMKEYDSYHLSFAEAAKVDFLVTTDKKFIRRAARFGAVIDVVNPITFLPEVEKWVQL
jgi:predicted nucleic acid-binding protein